jgi:hypothetical protein
MTTTLRTTTDNTRDKPQTLWTTPSNGRLWTPTGHQLTGNGSGLV